MMSVSRRWVEDWCEQGYVPDMNRERAVGISKIHETCTPPCPRLIAARMYLQEHGLVSDEADRD